MSLKSISPRTINKLHKNFQNSRVLTTKYRTRNLIKNLSTFNLNNKKIIIHNKNLFLNTLFPIWA